MIKSSSPPAMSSSLFLLSSSSHLLLPLILIIAIASGVAHGLYFEYDEIIINDCESPQDWGDTASLIYDGGLPTDMLNYIQSTEPGCVNTGSRALYVQYFKPPTFPWVYTQLCYFLNYDSKYNFNDYYIIGANATTGGTVAALAVDLNQYNRMPTSDTSGNSYSYKVYNRKVAAFRTSAGKETASFQAIPLQEMVIYQPAIYLGIEVDSCPLILGIGAAKTFDVPEHSSYFRNDKEGGDWYSGLINGLRAFALRAQGHPHVPAANEVIPGWTCARSLYMDNHTCHCNCGETPDPDCLLVGITHSPNCTAGQVCSLQTGSCIDPNWDSDLCDEANFGTDGVCDCNCGSAVTAIADPDCLEAVNAKSQFRSLGAVRGCPKTMTAAVTCINGQQCVDDRWKCDVWRYNDSKQCDCGCGIVDPDCINKDPELPSNCPTGQICSVGISNTQCMWPGWDEWACRMSSYNAGNFRCNCECGSYDPDCDYNNATVYYSTTESCKQCSYTGQCLTQKSCGNGHTEAPNEQCDGGIGCNKETCQCLDGWERTDPLSGGCVAICGDGKWKGDEECDGDAWCNKTTCKCIAGHPAYTNPATGKCAACQNKVLDAGEQCDQGLGCNTSCLCVIGYVVTDPVSTACQKYVSPATGSGDGGGDGGGTSAAVIAIATVGSVVLLVVVVSVVAVVAIFFLRRSLLKQQKTPQEMTNVNMTTMVSTQQEMMIPMDTSVGGGLYSPADVMMQQQQQMMSSLSAVVPPPPDSMMMMVPPPPDMGGAGAALGSGSGMMMMMAPGAAVGSVGGGLFVPPVGSPLNSGSIVPPVLPPATVAALSSAAAAVASNGSGQVEYVYDRFGNPVGIMNSTPQLASLNSQSQQQPQQQQQPNLNINPSAQ